MTKIRRSWAFGSIAFGWLASAPGALAAQQGAVALSGRVTILDKNDRPAQDVSQAVVWLTGENAPPGVPDTVEMATEGKQFLPHLVIVPRGSAVRFPNHDPFSHNVFSLSPEGPFDLGVYGRGEARAAAFPRTGVIRVYCNVHAQMRGLILVEESALFTQPGADGAFRLDSVPPGTYLLHAWHERAAGEVTRQIRVTGAPLEPVALALDARGYRFVQHKDKNGRSYSDRSRRY
jgi:plastocyanin